MLAISIFIIGEEVAVIVNVRDEREAEKFCHDIEKRGVTFFDADKEATIWWPGTQIQRIELKEEHGDGRGNSGLQHSAGTTRSHRPHESSTGPSAR